VNCKEQTKQKKKSETNETSRFDFRSSHLWHFRLFISLIELRTYLTFFAITGLM